MRTDILNVIHVFSIIALAAGCGSDDPAGADGSPPDGSSGEAVSDASPADSNTDGAGSVEVVVTDRGPVKGKLGASSRTFLGIPYAAPPTGALRWKPPQAAPAWTTQLAATAFGASCPQIQIPGRSMPTSYSEDCLTLNVWTPVPAPAKAPVMVWIHGGGFTIGGTALDTYDGQKLAEKAGVVVVSINYRLGPFGFLAHPSISDGSGNFGVQDQQAALTWVKKNITAFGGDPGNVTLFGESAGSISVGVHLAAPASKGLFHRAIMQSGGLGEVLIEKTEAAAQGKSLATKLGCDTAKDPVVCLRSKKTDDVIKALPLKAGFFFGAGVSWGPTIDGKVLPAQPMTLVKAGTFNKVPLLIGTNKDEGTLFLFLAGMMMMTQAQYQAAVTLMFGTAASTVLKEYPASAYASPGLAMSDFLADMAFKCPSRRTVRAVAAAGQPAYLYHFTVKPTYSLLSALGAFHSAEIPFVFDTSKFTPAEATLSGKMMGYWTGFAKSGDPDAAKKSWPRYKKTSDTHLELGLTISTGTGLRKKKCDFWDALMP